MPVLVGTMSGDAGSAPEIVIYSVGTDGMETTREFLSVAEAERHIVSVRQAINLSRAETLTAGRRPALGRRRFDGKEEAQLSASTSRIRTSDTRPATTTATAWRDGRTTGAV
jgi:hypothetical protein